MLRKLGIHRGSLKDSQSLDHGDADGDVAAERPKSSLRALSEPSTALLNRLADPVTGHGSQGHEVSIADSSFPSEEADVSISSTKPSDTLGLHIVHNLKDAAGDIIFVHGLGGSAMRTWSWRRDTAHFWPAWFGDDEHLQRFRVFTFGYNSNFKGSGTNLNIVDFAKDLLFHLLTFSHHDSEPIGSRPIIFIAHSLGGLVVKKAFIIGKHDDEYSSIVSRIYGILFLATPHRGAQYAKMLNNILSSAPIVAPPKAYVADLDTHSAALQDINEQFRTICHELVLVSFFETLKTSFGLTKILIVEKESGILGYPQETSNPLNADHHSICKYQSPEDANYVNVRNILRLWAGRMATGETAAGTMVSRAEMSSVDATISRVLSILGVREKAEEELNVHRAKVLEGTCRWIIQARELKMWIEGLEDPNISNTFWLIGLPATGKTVLSSVIIDHLLSRGKLCQYNFFASIHQTKRTAAYCLRSIATQLTFVSSEFRDRVLALHEVSGLRFNSQNQAFNVVWEKIFEGIIFRMRFPQPLYWILDAVDEANQQALLINHLTKIESLTPIGVFFVSRPIKIPPSPVQIAAPITYFLSEHDTRDDIQAFVQRSVQHILPSNKSIQKKVIEQILTKASGSFLWVRLALETLEGSWHTEDDIHQALTEMPQGMENLYAQMLAKVQAQPVRLRTMAKTILTWVTCAWRPLEISELEVALQPEFTGFIQLERTVVEICGHFVSIHDSKVSIIHMTARDFLTKNKENASFISSREGHAHIARKCLKHLSNDDWRQVFKRFHGPIDSPKRMKRQNKLLLAEQGHPFLGYSTCYWAYHISKSELSSRNLIEVLETFLNIYCLLWIEAIALSQNLSYLTRSTQYLKAYVKRMTRTTTIDVPESPPSLIHFPEHHAHVIEMWANDFIRVAAKFGSNLLQSPSSIHRLITPFCPRHSMIGETFGLITERTLVVTGLPNDDWSDCLASVSAGEDLTASKVLAGDTFFIVLVSSCGSIFLWSTDTCEQARVLQHNEYVTLMALDRSQNFLASAGAQTYRIWDVSSGDEIYRISKTSQALTLTIAFGATPSEFFFGLDDCSVTCYDVERMQERWSFRPSNPRALVQNCPRTMALSPDQKKVAMAWRGKPPVIWDLTGDSSQLPEQCRAMQSTDAVCAPEALHWLPNGDSVLILCQNTVIIDWRLYDEEQIEFSHIQPREMAISQDGSLLLTSDHAGTISVWTLPRFTLIYRLVNENEFIRNLAFSPDSQRFYDIRGSTCNVWEPDALVRAFNEDFEDQSSNGESSLAPEAVVRSDVRSKCQITALASDSRDRYFCVGRDDGQVLIQEALTGQKVRKVYGHSSTSAVIALSWSASGHYIISADDSGRVIAKRLEVKEEGKWAVFPVLDIRSPDTVQQFLFNKDEKLLLISTATADRVWNMKAKKEICCRDWGSGQSRRWITHPTNPNSLV